MDDNSNQLWSVEKIDTKWVSDGLENCFQEWTHYRPVLISAPTGRGKNHFIMKVLIPHAIETGQQVFLFSNRVALNVQQKKELLDTLSIPNIWTDEELQKQTSFVPKWQYAPYSQRTLGAVTVLSYQSALQFIQCLQPDSKIPIGGFPHDGRPGRGYAIFDEAHFFLNDALFNANTQVIFERLVPAFAHYTRIYMTATPDNIQDIINQYENQDDRKNWMTGYDLNDWKQGNYSANGGQNLLFYKFAQDYSNYNVTFFSKMEQLYEVVRETSASKEKWLFFINDKSRQREVASDLRHEASVKVDCFDSSKKDDSKLWSKLLNGEIPQDILLTTSALDNGVNITDPALHHIALECTDKISFMQMLGRKRRKDDEIVNLYVYSPPESVIKDRYKKMLELSEVINEYKAAPYQFIQYKWSSLHKRYRNLFWINDQQKPILNNFAENELQYIMSFYGDLLFQMQKASSSTEVLDVYPKQVLEWLGLSQDIHWVGDHNIEAAKDEMRQLLEKYMPSGVPKNEHEEFFNKFAELADIIYNGTKTIKKDARSGPSIMNQCLEDLSAQLGCTYTISGKGTWKITKQ